MGDVILGPWPCPECEAPTVLGIKCPCSRAKKRWHPSMGPQDGRAISFKLEIK